MANTNNTVVTPETGGSPTNKKQRTVASSSSSLQCTVIVSNFDCQYKNLGCKYKAQNSRDFHKHNSLCGWNPDFLEDRRENYFPCLYCEKFALDFPDPPYSLRTFQLTKDSCDEMMKNHVHREHNIISSNLFGCLFPACQKKFYSCTPLFIHKNDCHFKDHQQCSRCGYYEPPWRIKYHSCMNHPTVFPSLIDDDPDTVSYYRKTQ